MYGSKFIVCLVRVKKGILMGGAWKSNIFLSMVNILIDLIFYRILARNDCLFKDLPR